MVWESRDSGRLRASGVKSRMSTTRMVVRRLVCSAVVGAFLRSPPGAVGRDAERAGLQKINCWSPNSCMPDRANKTRCRWASDELSASYHDEEWGVPVHDDRLLFEFLILEGAQAGLSWI